MESISDSDFEGVHNDCAKPHFLGLHNHYTKRHHFRERETSRMYSEFRFLGCEETRRWPYSTSTKAVSAFALEQIHDHFMSHDPFGESKRALQRGRRLEHETYGSHLQCCRESRISRAKPRPRRNKFCRQAFFSTIYHYFKQATKA